MKCISDMLEWPAEADADCLLPFTAAQLDVRPAIFSRIVRGFDACARRRGTRPIEKPRKDAR